MQRRRKNKFKELTKLLGECTHEYGIVGRVWDAMPDDAILVDARRWICHDCGKDFALCKKCEAGPVILNNRCWKCYRRRK